jgi:hypothetical protein
LAPHFGVDPLKKFKNTEVHHATKKNVFTYLIAIILFGKCELQPTTALMLHVNPFFNHLNKKKTTEKKNE